MAKLHLSTKRLLVDKANTTMVTFIAISSFVTVFSLVASKALLSQRSYQAKVITEKGKARNQLKSNLTAAKTLGNAYQAFVGTQQNIIGGSTDGKADKDGDNAKIILDALPSKYDFPAITASLEKILSERNFKIDSIAGNDDEVAQSAPATETTISGPIEIPFQLGVSGNYGSMKDLISLFEHSIRPFDITTLTLSGDDSDIRLSLSAKTFYQPEKGLIITTKEVK